MKLALVTIGQTPRRDIIDDVEDLLHGIDYVEYGVLDGLDKEYIVETLAPKPGEEFYVTRLVDGSEVRVSKRIVDERLRNLIKSIEKSVDAIIVMCTGDFDLSSSKPLILPGRLLVKTVEALNPKSLGVIVPAAGQIEMAYSRWSRVSDKVVVKSWSPYTGSIEELARISRELRSQDLIVMDCIGYSRSHAKTVREVSGKPTIVPRILTIAVAIGMLRG